MQTIILMNDKGGRINAAIFGGSEADIDRARQQLDESVKVYPFLMQTREDMLDMLDKIDRAYSSISQSLEK